MSKYEQEILELVKKETGKELKLEQPPDSTLGDFALPCFPLAKEMRKAPNIIAQELSKKIKPTGNIDRIEANGPYLNFFIKKQNLTEETLQKILKEKEEYGKQNKNNKTILVEYPGPNTNKPLHLGHVRNMVIGYSYCRLAESQGNTVITVNVNNDRGVHVCKSMLAYQKWGKGDTPTKSKMKTDFFVGKYYVKFAKEAEKDPKLEEEAQVMLEKWENGERKTIALWKKMNKWAFDGFKKTYKTFNIKFEKEYYESETYKKGKEIVLEGLKNKIFQKDEKGAIIADLTSQGFDKKVLLRTNGTTVYMTQDLYLAKEKYEDFKYDKSIYVVATEQNYHFQVLFKILKMLKYPFADRCHHLAYGMVNLTTGKMKSREGTVVDADTLVEEITELAKQETQKRHPELAKKELNTRAKQIGMAAIRFYLLKFDTIKDILFDPQESISLEGETGPYVQYVHARCCSVLKKAGKQTITKINYSLLKEKQEQDLIMTLNKFLETTKEATEQYKPSTISRYLLDLCQQFNKFYQELPIIQENKELEKARLALVESVKIVVCNGLWMLGIEAPQQM